MSKIIVLDTSFLIEFFKIPVDSNANLHEQAVTLFEEAIINKYDIYCPLSVLYELANHIVDINHHLQQREIAANFTRTILQAWEEEIPFTIIPGNIEHSNYHDLARLPELCAEYEQTIRQGLGLTDCTIIDAARKLKQSYTSRQKRWPAHIWSLHRVLKALEPDNFGHETF